MTARPAHRRLLPDRRLGRLLSAATAACLLAVAGCSADADTPADQSATEGFVVAVPDDQPGLSQRETDGTYAGVDIDLARYVAEQLGESEVTFVSLPDTRVQQGLLDGDVDLVMGMVVDPDGDTPDGQPPLVPLAGPYLDGGQDLLVRTESPVRGPVSIGTRRVCGVDGSNDLARLREPDRAPEMRFRQQSDLGRCVDLLRTGAVDVVTGDDDELAGYAVDVPTVRVVGAPFTTEPRTIGLPPESADLAAVDAAIQRAIDDGAWADSLAKHLTSPLFPLPDPPAVGTAP